MRKNITIGGQEIYALNFFILILGSVQINNDSYKKILDWIKRKNITIILFYSYNLIFNGHLKT